MARKKQQQPRITPVRQRTSIVDGLLYFEDVRQCEIDKRESFEDCIEHEQAIRVVSLASGWYQYEWSGDTLVTSDIDLEMTLRAEIRGGTRHWYAYRRVFGKLYKRYVGQTDRVTSERLLTIARTLPTRKTGIQKRGKTGK